MSYIASGKDTGNTRFKGKRGTLQFLPGRPQIFFSNVHIGIYESVLVGCAGRI